MPRLGRASSGLKAVGTVRSFISLLREVSLDEIKEEAELTPLLAIVAATRADGEQLAQALLGPEDAPSVMVRTADGSLADLARYDAVIVLGGTDAFDADAIRRQIKGSNTTPQVIILDAQDATNPERARKELVDRLLNRATALGRAYPSLRAAAASAVVNQSARANAEFAFISNIPAVVPFVGGLLSASADLLVLTKNQVILVYKIAAIHGRDLDDRMGIARELLPVVGAGIAWRTVAREAASFLPLAAGTIPKVAIAFAGTQVAGRTADFYYRFGRKPPKGQLKEFYEQAMANVRELPIPGLHSENGGSPDATSDKVAQSNGQPASG